MRLPNFLDVRKLLPRERRRVSQREVAKGVVPIAKLTQAEAQKRAQRRVHRRAMTKAVVDGLRDNPAGSKVLRQFAKAAGYLVQDGDKLRRPTFSECLLWNTRRDEAANRQGHRLREAA